VSLTKEARSQAKNSGLRDIYDAFRNSPTFALQLQHAGINQRACVGAHTRTQRLDRSETLALDLGQYKQRTDV